MADRMLSIVPVPVTETGIFESDAATGERSLILQMDGTRVVRVDFTETLDLHDEVATFLRTLVHRVTRSRRAQARLGALRLER